MIEGLFQIQQNLNTGQPKPIEIVIILLMLEMLLWLIILISKYLGRRIN
jgi:hypothetical protein